jgi:hypothetical protein
MSNEEWEGLRKIISLPESARQSIEHIIWLYRGVSEIKYSPGDSRSRLASDGRAIASLRNQLEALLTDDLVLFQFDKISKSNFVPSRLAGKQYLETLLGQLKSASAALKNARSQIKPAKRGARTRSFLIFILIRQLDEILEAYRGKPLARSGKSADRSIDYVVAVCKLADRSIGKGSIDEAMKHVIQNRGGISSAVAR